MVARVAAAVAGVASVGDVIAVGAGVTAAAMGAPIVAARSAAAAAVAAVVHGVALFVCEVACMWLV